MKLNVNLGEVGGDMLRILCNGKLLVVRVDELSGGEPGLEEADGNNALLDTHVEYN